MLDFRIETFLSVCRHMSFTAASEELHITQPAVSQHIRFLEKTYGCPLFLRDGKRIAPLRPVRCCCAPWVPCATTRKP